MSSDGDDKQTQQKYSHPFTNEGKAEEGRGKNRASPCSLFPIPFTSFDSCSSAFLFPFLLTLQDKQ